MILYINKRNTFINNKVSSIIKKFFFINKKFIMFINNIFDKKNKEFTLVIYLMKKDMY